MTAPILGGPHCHCDDCGRGTCEETGHVEFPCRTAGCVLCGGPDRTTPEHWASDAGRFLVLSEDEQVRVRCYWQMYPLVRTAFDVHPRIADNRASDALMDALKQHGP